VAGGLLGTVRSMDGSLVVVGTPIGNLGDISPRAVKALSDADVIACEDTRRCRGLLSHLGIDAPPLIVINEHEEAGRVEQIVDRIAAGESVALTTDAGMPAISDPGELIVRAVADSGQRIEVVPGPTAASTALVASGLATGRWCFEGFLPRKGAARTERVRAVSAERRTTVLYEAPHRLERTLTVLTEAAGGDRSVVVARELTKLHEEIWRGSLDESLDWVVQNPPRGEFVIVLDGAPAPDPATDDALRAALRRELAAGLRTKEAAARVAEVHGVGKREAYELALEVASES
jgi:16S rRNA (cytidine1402-2'-O)-methyltransferase